MLNVVQVGYGYWGANVMRNLMASPKTRVVALCDTNPKRLAAAKGVYQKTTQYADDYQVYLNDPSVDAFALCIQTEPSFAVAKQILQAGKHLFIEKPMATTAERAKELTKLAKERNLILHCDHIMIYHPVIRAIMRMIDDGTLGELVYFDIARVNLGPIRMDVNAMLDLAVHDLAIIDYLSKGQTPHYVSAIGEKRYGQQETLTYLTMKYPNFIAHIKSSWISPVKERRILIAGTKKMVIFDDMRSVEKLMVYDQGIEPIEKAEEYGAYEFKARLGDITIPYIPHEDALRNSIEHFADCVENGKPSLSDGEHATKIVRILDQARESLTRTANK